MKKILTLACLFVMGWANTSPALPNEYTYYQPAQIYRRLTQAFTRRGISTVPPSLLAAAGFPLPAGHDGLVFEEQLIGQVGYVADVRRGYYQLVIADVPGTALLTVTELTSPCTNLSAGLCHRIDIVPENEKVAGQSAPFSVLMGELGLEYQRFGQTINVSAWRYELGDALKWTVDAVAALPGTDNFAIAFDRENLYRSLLSDPAVAANLQHVTVAWENGVLTVRGYVPSTPIYNLLVARVLESGVKRVRIEVDIRG